MKTLVDKWKIDIKDYNKRVKYNDKDFDNQIKRIKQKLKNKNK